MREDSLTKIMICVTCYLIMVLTLVLSVHSSPAIASVGSDSRCCGTKDVYFESLLFTERRQGPCVDPINWFVLIFWLVCVWTWTWGRLCTVGWFEGIQKSPGPWFVPAQFLSSWEGFLTYSQTRQVSFQGSSQDSIWAKVLGSSF